MGAGGPTPIDATPEQVQVLRRPSGRGLGVVLSVFALLCASGFAVIAANASDGASTPESAVEQLFDALEHNDIVGLLEVLPPSERAAIGDPMLDVIDELQRLEILADFDESSTPGFEFDVEGLELASTGLGDGVSAVRITGGTITSTVRPGDLPLGDTVRDLLDEELAEADAETDTSDLADSDVQIVTVREGDGWHVSLFYSIAEAARAGEGSPPDFGNGLPAIGADSPEGAVRGLLQSAVDLDLGGVIGMLPPDEMRVLYDYGPLFVDEADEAAAEVRAEGFTGQLSDVQLHAEGGGDVRTVVIDALDVTLGDEESSVHLAYGDGCIDFEITYESYTWDDDGRDDGGTTLETDELSWCEGGEMLVDGEPMEESEWGFTSELFGDPSELLSSFALRVVQVDGAWYVSPTRSLFEPMLSMLEGLEPADLEELLDGFLGDEGFFTSASEEVFVPVGGSIGEPIDEACFAPYDELGDDATDAEWEAAADAVDECFGDATFPEGSAAEEDLGELDPLGVDALDDLFPEGSDMSAMVTCAMAIGSDGPETPSVTDVEELYDCLLDNGVDATTSPVLACLDEYLAAPHPSGSEGGLVEGDALSICLDQAFDEMPMLGQFESIGSEVITEPEPDPASEPTPGAEPGTAPKGLEGE